MGLVCLDLDASLAVCSSLRLWGPGLLGTDRGGVGTVSSGPRGRRSVPFLCWNGAEWLLPWLAGAWPRCVLLSLSASPVPPGCYALGAWHDGRLPSGDFPSHLLIWRPCCAQIAGMPVTTPRPGARGAPAQPAVRAARGPGPALPPSMWPPDLWRSRAEHQAPEHRLSWVQARGGLLQSAEKGRGGCRAAEGPWRSAQRRSQSVTVRARVPACVCVSQDRVGHLMTHVPLPLHTGRI